MVRKLKTQSRKKRGTSKTRKTTRRVITENQKSLAVYHNPFSRATKQPKIPDGKASESLGFQTQAAGELQAANTAGYSTSDGMLHILLYGGQSSGMVVMNDVSGGHVDFNTTNAQWTNDKAKIRTIGFDNSNNLNCSVITSSLSDPATISSQEAYAYWRLVSQGLRLALMNPAEEDDGWFEAIRMVSQHDSNDWLFSEVDNFPGSDSNYSLSPYGLLNSVKARSLVNKNSYTTGLLRDLHEHLFRLNPIGDEHDMRQQRDTFDGANWIDDFQSADTVANGHYIQPHAGSDDFQRYIQEKIDFGHDMIYIRIHGRTAGNPTRMHFNLVSNQEIVFEDYEKEARFMTRGQSSKNMDAHMHHRKLGSNSASVLT